MTELEKAKKEIEMLKSLLKRERMGRMEDVIVGTMQKKHDKRGSRLKAVPWGMSYTREQYLAMVHNYRVHESSVEFYSLYVTIEKLLEKVSDEDFDAIRNIDLLKI